MSQIGKLFAPISHVFVVHISPRAELMFRYKNMKTSERAQEKYPKIQTPWKICFIKET